MEPIKMTLAASVTLYNVIQKILVETTDGTEKERDFPFDLKYKLQRNRTVLQPDFEKFNNKRVELIREMGTEDKEKNIISIPDDKVNDFRDKLLEYASEQVEHQIVKLSVEDVELIKISGVTGTEMELFMAVMVDDPEFMESVSVETKPEVEVNPAPEEAPPVENN